MSVAGVYASQVARVGARLDLRERLTTKLTFPPINANVVSTAPAKSSPRRLFSTLSLSPGLSFFHEYPGPYKAEYSGRNAG